MSRRTLACVPQKAAVLFGFGLNPAEETAKGPTNGKAAALKSVTGLDIFRELFGNILGFFIDAFLLHLQRGQGRF